MFGTKHPFQVFKNLFSREVEAKKHPEQDGVFHIQLKRPFNEIREDIEKQLEKFKKPARFLGSRSFEARGRRSSESYGSNSERAQVNIKNLLMEEGENIV